MTSLLEVSYTLVEGGGNTPSTLNVNTLLTMGNVTVNGVDDASNYSTTHCKDIQIHKLLSMLGTIFKFSITGAFQGQTGRSANSGKCPEGRLHDGEKT